MHEKSFYELLTLKPHIRALSIETMTAFLMSKKLDCSEENEVYYLLCAWFCQSSDVKRLYRGQETLFPVLSEKIHFQHMTADFLACLESCCPFAVQSGLIPTFFRVSYICDDKVSKSVAKRDGIDLGPPDRGVGGGEFFLETKFLLEDLVKLKKGEHLFKVVGLAFPFSLQIGREIGNTFGVWCGVLMPDIQGGSFKEPFQRHVGFQYSLQVGSVKMPSMRRLF